MREVLLSFGFASFHSRDASPEQRNIQWDSLSVRSRTYLWAIAFGVFHNPLPPFEASQQVSL
jgi:hypothetical protein